MSSLTDKPPGIATGDAPPQTIVAIIPLYNGARFIGKAVQSVFSQSRVPDELIVVDDGSTDEGPDVVATLARTSPVRLLRKTNGGQSSARNYGVAHSRASHIAFLDQDDFWYPDHLAALLAPFNEPRAETLGWTYANLDEGDESGALLTRSFLHTRPALHPKTSLRDCLADDMFVLPSASLISRVAFEAVGGFDERLSGYEDDDLFLRIFLAGYGNVFVDKPLSMWRIYGTSTTSTPAMTRSRMVYARKVLQQHGPKLHQGRTLARDAIAPRFIRNLFGEYARAGRRNDRAGMSASLDDIKTLMLPHLPLHKRIGLQFALAVLSAHQIGLLFTGPRFLAKVRRVLGGPEDRRAQF